MNVGYNPLSILLLFAASIILVIALLTFHRLESRVRPFFYLMLATAIWSFGYGVQLGANTRELIMFCTYFSYIGIGLYPGLWTVFVLSFIGKSDWLTPLNKVLVFLIPVLTIIIVYTNSWHHLYYTSLSIESSGSMTFLTTTKGPWYLVFTLYFYSMLLWGAYLLLAKFKGADKLYKKQRNVILVAACIPWLFNIIYQLGFRLYNYVDPTPFMFIVTTVVICIGFYRYRLFDVVPIARGRIVEEMREGVLVLNRQNKVIDINPEMCRIIGREKDVVGSSVQSLLPGFQNLDIETPSLKNELREMVIPHVDGDRIYSVSVTPVLENEVLTCSILLFKDITELYAKEAIAALMQKKDDFLSIASHELKTPITTLKGNLQILNKIAQRDENEPYLKFINQAERQVNKLTGLVKDLLDVSKIESGKIQFNLSEFSIAEVIDECKSFAQLSQTNHAVRIEGDLNLQVIADKDRLEQVVCNLVSNAIKYSPNGDEISVSVSRVDEECLIAIKDKGIGIPREMQNNLFQKFFRVEKGEGRFPGLGIGLFISKEIVERLGGKIWVESEENRGSCFYVTVPLANRKKSDAGEPTAGSINLS